MFALIVEQKCFLLKNVHREDWDHSTKIYVRKYVGKK